MAQDSERPRLLFIAPYFPPAYYGGVVQVYLGLLRRLSEFDVLVVSDRHGLDTDQLLRFDAESSERYGFKMARIGSFEFRLKDGERSMPERLRALGRFFLKGRKEWAQLIGKYKPDLILCGGTYAAGWLMGLRSGTTPLVNYLHGEELTMKVGPVLLRPIMRRFQMRCLRSADLNIAVSRYTAELLGRMADVPSERITVLPNFVDTERFKVSGERPRSRVLRDLAGLFVILSLARLDPRKGIDQALRALALLDERRELPDGWMYVIAGRGKEEERLRELTTQLGMTQHVRFYGFVEDTDLLALYEAADVFLQPNRDIDGDTEGFGIVFLEASACGVPVIGGIAGGTADAIEEGVTGFRVDGDSIPAIAHAILRLSSDSELRQQMGAQGAAMVASQFGLDQAAARFEDLLRGVMESRAVRLRMPVPVATDRV